MEQDRIVKLTHMGLKQKNEDKIELVMAGAMYTLYWVIDNYMYAMIHFHCVEPC